MRPGEGKSAPLPRVPLQQAKFGFELCSDTCAVVMWAFLNLFRIAGDLCHLLSFVVMFWKLHTSRSVAGQGWMQHSTPSCCAPGQS
jgi:hypothetical protein